jgi:hypothetical protein
LCGATAPFSSLVPIATSIGTAVPAASVSKP